MEHNWKQFVEWATSSRRKVFLWARLKLTAIYVGIVAIVIGGFSFVLYQSLSQNLMDANDDAFTGVQSHEHFVHATLESTSHELLIIDLIIILVSAVVSYILASYTLRPIQKSMEAQKRFSENASHELRTPLAVMRNDNEILLRNPNPSAESVRQVTQSNIEEIDLMTVMTENLLLLARSDNSALVSTDKVDVSAVANKIVEKMRPLSKHKNIALNIDANIPCVTLGNSGALERIFTNLIKNSIEHTPSGGSISIKVINENDSVLVTVIDTGSGIDEKDLPNIFERFYKGQTSKGTGLGLAIVKELVNQHKGSVQISSVKGTGTVVTVKLNAFS